MSKLRRSTFATITLTVLERFSRNSAGRMLSGGGASSHDEKTNKQDASWMQSMQMLVNTDFKSILLNTLAIVNSGGYLHRMVQSALQKIFSHDNA